MSQCLIILVAQQRYGLPLHQVREVMRGAWPQPLVRAPFGCLGLLNVRGEVVPVLELGMLLGLRRPDLQERAEILMEGHLVLTAAPMPLALVVDHVLDVDAPASAAGAAAGTGPTGAEAPAAAPVVLDLLSLVNPQRQRLLQRAVHIQAGSTP